MSDQKLIFHVEDNPDNRLLVRRLLTAFGYEVVEAENAKQALEVLKTLQPDLILMDMIMPKKGGREAYEEIRALRPEARVLFSSGYSPEFIESRGGLGTGLDLLTKPVHPLDLLRKVREILDR